MYVNFIKNSCIFHANHYFIIDNRFLFSNVVFWFCFIFIYFFLLNLKYFFFKEANMSIEFVCKEWTCSICLLKQLFVADRKEILVEKENVIFLSIMLNCKWFYFDFIQKASCNLSNNKFCLWFCCRTKLHLLFHLY